jgi:hypothetical protein
MTQEALLKATARRSAVPYEKCALRGEVRAAAFEPDPPCERGGMIKSELPT